MKYRVVVGFTLSKLYEVNAEDQEDAAEMANELALQEENALMFDSIEVVDFM